MWPLRTVMRCPKYFLVDSDPGIEKMVRVLRDRFKVGYVAPAHSTGEPAFRALKKAFDDRYLYAGLRTTFSADCFAEAKVASCHASLVRESSALPEVGVGGVVGKFW